MVKRKRSRPQRRQPGFNRRKSPEEQSLKLDEWAALCDSGMGMKAAASKVGVSLQSIYRWDKNRVKAAAIEDRSKPSVLNIPRAIRIMIDAIPSTDTERLAAIFEFSVWLRWPHEPALHSPAMTTLLAAYWMRTLGVTAAQSLGEEHQRTMLSYMDLELIATRCSWPGSETPMFVTDPIDGGNTERELLAEVTSYLLSVEPEEHVRSRPSLRKAMFLLEQNAFRTKWKVHTSTFRALWSKYNSASLFYFVELICSSLNWNLDPADNEFAGYVQDLMTNRGEVRAFFEQCKFAVLAAEQQKQLGTFGSDLPNILPPELKPLPFPMPVRPPEHTVKLQGYISSYN